MDLAWRQVGVPFLMILASGFSFSPTGICPLDLLIQPIVRLYYVPARREPRPLGPPLLVSGGHTALGPLHALARELADRGRAEPQRSGARRQPTALPRRRRAASSQARRGWRREWRARARARRRTTRSRTRPATRGGASAARQEIWGEMSERLGTNTATRNAAGALPGGLETKPEVRN